jgi:cwf18 pre-mRNA splicing factor
MVSASHELQRFIRSDSRTGIKRVAGVPATPTPMTDRKARLAALRAKAGREKEFAAVTSKSDDAHHDDNGPLQEQFASENTVFQGGKCSRDNPATGTRDDVDPSELLKQALLKARKEGAGLTPTVSEHSGENLVSAKAPTELIAKKINADLKRGIQSKLDKLERRTQKAIVALLRQRLEKEASADGNTNPDPPGDDDNEIDLD